MNTTLYAIKLRFTNKYLTGAYPESTQTLERCVFSDDPHDATIFTQEEKDKISLPDEVEWDQILPLTNKEKREQREYEYWWEYCEGCESATLNRHVYDDEGNPHNLVVCTECGEGYNI